MNRVRGALRIAGIAAWTLGWFLLWTTGTLLTLPVPRARLRWRQLAVRGWSLGMIRLVGMRRRIRGRPPHAPFLLVSNHLSYLDILLLYSCVDGVFVAKLDMRSWPVLGALARLMGTIWIDRTVRRDAMRTLERIAAAIARGDGVILFPEGTTSGGSGLLPMRPALLEWAARESYPVHLAAISYRTTPGTLPAERAVCWWDNAPFGSHALTLLGMKGFDARVEFIAEPVTAGSRGELVERARQGIAARFEPVGWSTTAG